MSRTVNWEKQGRVAIIQLFNPPINCIDQKFLHDLDLTLDEIEQTESIEVIVMVSLNSKIFASGRNDYNEELPSGDYMREFSRILKRIANHKYPTMSIITGTAIGAGFELALACDLRISGESAKYGFYSNVRLTPVGKECLMELIGPAKAKELMWFGHLIDAEEAQKIGLINRMIEDSHVLYEGIEMAKSIFLPK